MKSFKLIQKVRIDMRRRQLDYRVEQILMYWVKQYIDWCESYGKQEHIPLSQSHLLAYLHRLVWMGERPDRFRQAAVTLHYLSESFGKGDKPDLDHLLPVYNDSNKGLTEHHSTNAA
jgi:hypothetical protein